MVFFLLVVIIMGVKDNGTRETSVNRSDFNTTCSTQLSLYV